MKKINISTKKYSNLFTLVDDEDFVFFNQWKWGISTKGYVIRKENGKNITLHRLIHNTPEDFQTDHINRNKLDNRKKNLRTVTNSINHFNIGMYKHNKSGFKGVYWDKQNKKWRAGIQLNGKTINLGRYKNLFKALKARFLAERGILEKNKKWIFQS